MMQCPTPLTINFRAVCTIRCLNWGSVVIHVTQVRSFNKIQNAHTGKVIFRVVLAEKLNFERG